MERNGNTLLERIARLFPESDRVILSEVIERRAATIRYLAQIHEVTMAEVAEVVDVMALTSLARAKAA